MDSKVKHFMERTGTDPSTAKQMLEESYWNVDQAVQVYKFMEHSSKPPAGPQKNVEAKQGNRVGTNVVVAGGANVLTSSPSNSLNRKLKRGLSKTTDNIQLVNKARDIVLHDITESSEGGSDHCQHFVETPEYTFILPDITKYPEDFRAFLHKDLIETSTLVSLEQAGRLNWWADMDVCQRLLPLATTGDGNCLLHAASLGMWGFHDRELTLRKALYHTTTNGLVKGAYWRRWRWHQTQVNKQSGLILSEEEWQQEWSNLLKLASSTPKTNPGSHVSCCDSPATKGLMERTQERENEEDGEVFYESLEEFHVFILAHVLRRPIIVAADTILKDCNGDALAPIPFGGIYLPLECNPKECHRSPLLLTYDAAHFSALVAMETSDEHKMKLAAAIPLVDPEFKLLPIHFMVDPGPNFVWGKDEADPKKVKNLELATEDKLNLIKKYLTVERIHVTNSPVTLESRGGSNGVRSNDAGTRLNNASGKPQLTRSTSLESDESSNSSGSGKGEKEKKTTKKTDKDKDKDKKQKHTSGHSFGSIGKQMQKKLKKIGKGGKESEKEKNKTNNLLGTVTQTTKRASLTVEMLNDHDHILVAKLQFKRLEYQQQMVNNYLQSARERFDSLSELHKQQEEEMKRKAELKKQQAEAANKPVECATPDCSGRGTQATSYLCPTCFNKAKQHAVNVEKGPQMAPLAQCETLDTPRLPTKSSPALLRQDTLMNAGKSKFYTLTDESHSLPKQPELAQQARQTVQLPPPSYGQKPLNSMAENLNNITTVGMRPKDHKPVGVELSRSSFYDESLSSAGSSPHSTISKASNLSGPYIVNNLHNGPREQNINVNTHVRKEKLVKSIPPIMRTQYMEDMDEPPLRPEFARQRAMRVKDDDVNVRSVGHDTKHNSYHPQQQHQQGSAPPHYQQGMPPVDHTNKEDSVYVVRVQGGPPRKQQQCITEGCLFYGTDTMNKMCSNCYKQQHKTRPFIPQSYN